MLEYPRRGHSGQEFIKQGENNELGKMRVTMMSVIVITGTAHMEMPRYVVLRCECVRSAALWTKSWLSA